MTDHIEAVTQTAAVRIREAAARSGLSGQIDVLDAASYPAGDGPSVFLVSCSGKRYVTWVVGEDMVMQECGEPWDLLGFTRFPTAGPPWAHCRRDFSWARVEFPGRSFPPIAVVRWASSAIGGKYDRRAAGETLEMSCSVLSWPTVREYCAASMKRRWRASMTIDAAAVPGGRTYYIKLVGSQMDLDAAAYTEHYGGFA